MKRLICGILSFIMFLSLNGCLSKRPPTKETGTSAAVSSEEEELLFALNETAAFKDLKFTANEIVESGGKDFFEPKENHIFVGVKFTIENISDKEQAISSLLLFEGYADDIKCEYSLNAVCAFDNSTLDGSLAPGKKLVGWYALEVPKNWTSIELHIQSNWLSSNKAKFVFKK